MCAGDKLKVKYEDGYLESDDANDLGISAEQKVKPDNSYLESDDVLINILLESIERTTQINQVVFEEEARLQRERRRLNNRKGGKVYQSRHPEKVRMRNQARRDHRTKTNSVRRRDVELQYQAQKGRCWWCGEQLQDNWEVDHRIPLTRGGENTPGNIVIVHLLCNRSKGAKMPWEFNGRLL